MRAFLVELIRKIATGVLAHYAVTYIVVAIPFVVALAAFFLASLPWQALTLVSALALGWGLTLLAGALWYTDNYNKRIDRMQSLARAMYRSDLVLPKLSNDDAEHSSLHAELNTLLKEFCQVLSYRHALERKGAAFLIKNATGLMPVAQFNHDYPFWAERVADLLSKNQGLAGEAMKLESVRMLEDSWKPPRGSTNWIDWPRQGGTNSNKEPSEFRGRAAAPVTVLAGGAHTVIGALCFDTKTPGRLSEEDLGLFTLFADKVGALWHFCNGTSPAAGDNTDEAAKA